MTNETSTPTNVGSTAGLGVISRAEWESRYAAQVRKRAGWTHEEAAECARVGAEVYEQNELDGGATMPVWRDNVTSSPESEADEEMSCWTDDGEG